tara:strand:- start:3236 stop:4015 length:780 start_codon:yes stop_codon:yes gene_type:complete
MSTNQKCVICLENKKVYVNCPHCEEGNYCKDCITQLVNGDKYETCSICRRKDWYKDDKNIENLLYKKSEQDKMNKLSDMLEENENNYYHIISYNNIRNIITIILFICISTLIGYYTMFELFELENNFAENITENNIITITISFLTGLLVYLIIFIMILINKLILGDDWYECCCNPMIMLPTILLLLLGTYLGRIIIDGTGLTLNEDDKIIFAISFLIGNSLIIGPVIIMAICSKCMYKIREFREACIDQDNNVNGDEMI